VSPTADVALYDFGGASVSFTFPLPADGTALEALVPLAEQIYESKPLRAAARRILEILLREINPAVKSPMISEMAEDYAVYRFEDPRESPDHFIERHTTILAGIVRADPGALSSREISEALAARLSYSQTDAVIIDCNAAILLGPGQEDVLAILEFANIEILELRLLDDRLDEALARAYDAAQRTRSMKHLFNWKQSSELRLISHFHLEAAALFEGVNHALKLVGDQYLARLYRLASDRLRLPEWDANIIRKLDTLDGIYDKVSDRAAHRRMEVLEWIVIILIAFEVVMAFVR